MVKTLADMTTEERANCVGMWADAMGQGLGVIVNATELSDCWVLFPEDGGSVATCRNQRVTPRFDLPRAWTPDGEPELAQALAEETWEYIAEWCDNGVWAPIEIEMFDGVFPNLTAARGYIKVAKTRGAYENTRIVRRRVSPPEVINE